MTKQQNTNLCYIELLDRGEELHVDYMITRLIEEAEKEHELEFLKDEIVVMWKAGFPVKHSYVCMIGPCEKGSVKHEIWKKIKKYISDHRRSRKES